MSSTNETATPIPLPVIPEAIPAALRSLPQWVVWSYVEDRDPETGEIDYDKPPLNARGGAGSSTNPRTWSTFGDAITAYRKRKLDSIGFVLTVKKVAESPVLIAVDLDHCRNPQMGEIEEWAAKIIAQLNSYTEASPSGTGIRIFLYGRLPVQGRKRGQFEVYCTARYVTVTGQRVEGTPSTIESREDEILAVHKQIWPELHEPKQPANGRIAPTVDLSDIELIEKARKAKNGARFSALWNGDTGGFSSHSEADLALCSYLAFWCGPNSSERIDALFRQSGLFRSKWNREYYRTKTIRKSLEGRSEFYEPRRRASTNGPHAANGNGHNKDKPPATPSSSPTSGQDDHHLTDLGNAKRVVARHGADLHFCHDWKQFLVWDGRRWAIDNTGEAVRRVKDTQVAFYC